MINRKKYKPCPECRGIGKKSGPVCTSCGGYGSVGLKVVMQGLRKTNEGSHTSVVGGKCPLPRHRDTRTRTSWHVADQPPLGARVYDVHDPRHVGRLEAVLWSGTYVIRFGRKTLAHVPKARVRVAE